MIWHAFRRKLCLSRQTDLEQTRILHMPHVETFCNHGMLSFGETTSGTHHAEPYRWQPT